MECNKEEAVRAKDIAESKMQCKEFTVARKIILKAQQLFPELENLSQMLTVCEVHCSAEVKVNGEMDWYSILQVQPTVDESSIKKQYRKLALVLHPDKNQFPGAEAAFKLIGEAQMTLLDRTKRHIYDIRRNAVVKAIPPKQPLHQARSARTNFSTVNLNGVQPQQQQQPFAASQTFWTICPVCGMRYQYYRSILNKALRCQNCLKPFVAHDLSAKAVPSAANPGQSNSGNPPTQIPVPQTNNLYNQSQSGSMSSSNGFKSEQRGVGCTNRSANAKLDTTGSTTNGVKFTNVDSAELDPKKQADKISNSNSGHKRGRRVIIDSSDSDSSDAELVPSRKQYDSSSTPRRSSRHKQNVIYSVDESEDDDDFVKPPSKKLRDDMANMADDKMSGKLKENILHEEKLSNGTEKAVKHGSKEGACLKEKTVLESGSSVASGFEHSADPQYAFNYPDPEFFDFENFRNPTKFAVDQIWAIYDNVDGMPRFYARIRKIEGPNFRVRFTWLEHNPTNDAEIAWSDAELPVACGSYKLGKSETSEDLLMFSHRICWAKGKRKNCYDVYPLSGEVWALFKHWNINWSSDADNHSHYEYEVVEVISEFAEGTGITVIPLVKVEGFVSLFMRAKAAPFIIPPGELLKFSHYVPYYRLKGTEREGVPRDCLELDCASLPNNFRDVFPSVNLQTAIGSSKTTDKENASQEKGDTGIGSANVTTDKVNPASHKKGDTGIGSANGRSHDLHPDKPKVIDLEASTSSGSQYSSSQDRVARPVQQPKIHANEKHNECNDNDLEGSNEKDADEIDSLSPMPTSPETFELPDTEFHSFDEEKKIENFEHGQIWALYSDIDKYPKYYGYIRKVDTEKCKVLVAWLESCSQHDEEKRWLKDDMPVSCGIFKVSRQSMMFETTDTFSHIVAAEQNGKGQFTVLPKVHEIWAVYKSWRVGWSRSDLENCEYEVVEIFEDCGFGMKVNILTKVDEHRTVFCPSRDRKAESTMIIPSNEYIRFSHRIPAFPLNNGHGAGLMGCWELDTASVPEILLCSD